MVLAGGGGTGRPIVEDLVGGGGGAAAGGGAARLGGRDGTRLLVAALDPEASVAAETSDGAAGRARGEARGSWNWRSGGGGGGSVGAGADGVAERGMGGGFARPAIFADHQHQHYNRIDTEFKTQYVLVAFVAAGFSFGIPPAKSPPSCGGPPPEAGAGLAPLERPATAVAAADAMFAPPALPLPPVPGFLPSTMGPLRSFVTAFLSALPA